MQASIDFIGVGVGAILLDDSGRVFLAERGPQAKNERGTWEFPGGAVECGEPLAAAWRRAVRGEVDGGIEGGGGGGGASAIGWFAIDELPDKLSQITRENLKNFQTLLQGD